MRPMSWLRSVSLLPDTRLPDTGRTVLRRCVSCRKLKPRQELIGLTWSRKDGILSLNGSPPVQGRSAYVCDNVACLGDALKHKRLGRSLKRALPGDIVDSLKNRLDTLRATP